jgi:uncharacterized protein (DUF302 family)
MATSYGYTRRLEHVDYEQALDRVSAALKSEGFGVIMEIDVKETLKKKIDVDFHRYKILGACNPPLAYRALTQEPLVGLLLPCNVVVYDDDRGGSVVSFINPRELFKLVERPDMQALAEEVDARLRRALDRV